MNIYIKYKRVFFPFIYVNKADATYWLHDIINFLTNRGYFCLIFLFVKCYKVDIVSNWILLFWMKFYIKYKVWKLTNDRTIETKNRKIAIFCMRKLAKKHITMCIWIIYNYFIPNLLFLFLFKFENKKSVHWIRFIWPSHDLKNEDAENVWTFFKIRYKFMNNTEWIKKGRYFQSKSYLGLKLVRQLN